MRFAFISDIHANLPACQTVLADISTHNVDRIICLGDVVGYGPQPAETLNVLHQNVDYFVMGNHDAALCNMLPMDAFNDDAADMIRWTRKHTAKRAQEFLRKQPLIIQSDDFLCAHGTADSPETFGYVYDEDDTRTCLAATDHDLIFLGHTHRPGIHYINRENVYREAGPTNFLMEDGKRYIVNVGSVGMSRDGDFRSSYCIFDSADASVSFHRVAFDVEALRALASREEALSAQVTYLLAGFDDQSRGPVREHVDFSPVKENASVFIEQSTISSHKPVMWKLISAGLLAACLGALVMAWTIAHNKPAPSLKPPTEIATKDTASIELLPTSLNGISLIQHGTVTQPNEPLDALSLTLADPGSQNVQQVHPDHIIITNSMDNIPVELSSKPLNVNGCDKVQFYLLVHSEEPVKVPPTLFVDYLKNDGTVLRNAVTKAAVPVRGKPGEVRIQKTTPKLPRYVRALRVRLKWLGSGQLRVHAFTAKGK